MKLYATTTSERASKGQGGNDFLEVNLTYNDFGSYETLGKVIMREDQGTIKVIFQPNPRNLSGKDDIILRTIKKGNKQKDEEVCRHNKPNGWCCDF